MTPTRLRRRGPKVAAGVVAVLVLAGGLAGCAKTLKASDVESAVTRNIMGQLQGTRVSVNCPGGQTARKGARFTCAARIGGRAAAVDVRLLDDSGRFSFTVRSPRSPSRRP